MENLIDGRAIAADIHAETTLRVETLKKDKGITPGGVFIRVGDDPASKVYVGMKEKKAHELGIRSDSHILPEDTSEEELLEIIQRYNENKDIHGILVQAPLPSHIDEAKIFAAVSPAKDVDGFHPMNVGKLLLGDTTGFRPCTPAGVHELLIRCGVQIEGAEVVVLGRGNIVGKPMTSILCQKAPNANATVTLCHSRSKNTTEHCKRADIIVAAMGVPEFLKVDMIKPGVVIIDVGVNRIADPTTKKGNRLVGDVDFKAIQPIAGKITPNPGGVGPMTIAILMQNTVRAAEMASS
ncbi:bifunctional 5,10-methylenetetrahydrofolate dehydrogenase/5,10-methenyltetrahydrofolate cyclohydrolase [Verrucomicrobia bacterium]|nr:bifunctional 5,10-methylenetetrahydrofolate dehydrogenase/5,10-methenyltetrahydrofolate cyclohydrolase [Verrucomicrobiota bacterium]